MFPVRLVPDRGDNDTCLFGKNARLQLRLRLMRETITGTD